MSSRRRPIYADLEECLLKAVATQRRASPVSWQTMLAISPMLMSCLFQLDLTFKLTLRARI